MFSWGIEEEKLKRKDNPCSNIVRNLPNAKKRETVLSLREARVVWQAAKECGYDALIASLTFLAVAGRKVQLELFNQFDVPINMERVLHRDQKILFHRPILAGDKLYFDSYLDSVTESHGAVVTEIRGEVTDEAGKPVLTSIVTVMGEAASDTEADEISAQIAAARDAAIAKMIAGQSSKSN